MMYSARRPSVSSWTASLRSSDDDGSNGVAPASSASRRFNGFGSDTRISPSNPSAAAQILREQQACRPAAEDQNRANAMMHVGIAEPVSRLEPCHVIARMHDAAERLGEGGLVERQGGSDLIAFTAGT